MIGTDPQYRMAPKWVDKSRETLTVECCTVWRLHREGAVPLIWECGFADVLLSGTTVHTPTYPPPHQRRGAAHRLGLRMRRPRGDSSNGET